MENKDTFMLGGQEFSSRFILGSGKYSLDLIKASVENAGAQIITLALRRANQDGRIFRKVLPCFRIHPVREMLTKQFVLHACQEKLAAAIL